MHVSSQKERESSLDSALQEMSDQAAESGTQASQSTSELLQARRDLESAR